jgi:Histidine kinase-, DNA gyrase B-, and HSP90-like ATPase
MSERRLSKPLTKVSIRPGVSILSVLRHLNYKPWFALAEFVDNALQSYLDNKTALEARHGTDFKLRVRIDIESAPTPRMSIKDNAAGIAHDQFPRAFRPAAIPADKSGLSEFGMGMKSASCWFSPRWHVRTKALDESVERLVRFDIDSIVHDQIEELEIREVQADGNAHFTEIVLEDLHHVPVKKTLSKVKEHLTDIFRVFVREGILELKFGNDVLTYQEPPILVAPYEREPAAGARRWRKHISFDLGGGMLVSGFAALRDPGNYARAGFGLFRRRRLIQGSGEEGYRPPLIFGQPGSFRSLRLFGELHLEGFEISHTKDGFRWDENEQPFLELLKEHLDSPELPLLKQADAFRVLVSRADRAQAAELAVERTAEVMERGLPDVLPKVADAPPVDTPRHPLAAQSTLAAKELQIDFRGERWLIRIQLTDEPAESQWLAISDQPPVGGNRVIELRVSLAHPFMVRFAQTDPDDIEMLLRVAAGLGLAETLARQTGHRFAGTIRRNLNDILREALSLP